MEDRLVALLKSEGINPTRFAERIGVQRSSMSHILSGRNKPSFDFIVKILDSFPSVNPDWLLRGKGLMYKDDVPQQPSLFSPLSASRNDQPSDVSLRNASNHGDTNDAATNKNSSDASLSASTNEKIVDSTDSKKIEKILILYSDKSFSYYNPNSI
jgi:transcriptional regulator with XRE-family HTH domain